MGVAATTVDGLFDRLDKLRQLAAELARQAAREKDLARLDRLQANLRRATENGEIVGTYVRWVLALGHAWLVRADLERSRWLTLAGGVLVVIGAVLFFSVTGSGRH